MRKRGNNREEGRSGRAEEIRGRAGQIKSAGYLADFAHASAIGRIVDWSGLRGGAAARQIVFPLDESHAAFDTTRCTVQVPLCLYCTHARRVLSASRLA